MSQFPLEQIMNSVSNFNWTAPYEKRYWEINKKSKCIMFPWSCILKKNLLKMYS